MAIVGVRLDGQMVAKWIERRCPMLNKAIRWLTEKPGRKRGVAAAFAILAGLIRAAGEAISRACDGGLLEGGVCSWDVAPIAGWADVASTAAIQLVEPGLTFSALVMGVWGLAHARKRAKKAQRPRRKVFAGAVLLAFLLASPASAQIVGGVIAHRTITVLDGQVQPLAADTLWDENPSGFRHARLVTDIVVRGTTALADDPELTFRPYVRAGGSAAGVVGGATSVAYTRPRLEDLSTIKCQKTVNIGVAYTDYSAAVIDNSAGTVADFSSLDTVANGDWVIIGSSTGPVMGAAWDSTTPNGNAATFTLEYWDGDSWESLANSTDGTASGGATFAVDGQMTWDLPTDWAASAINSITAYWVRIGVSAALDADTTLAEMDLLLPIRASIDVEVMGDDILFYLESLSAITGTAAYSGSVSLVWR